jgi:regulator of replication initiation timing
MERDFQRKIIKAHYHILTCLDVAFNKQDINLIYKNVRRLNDMTTYLLRSTDLMMGQIETITDENHFLTLENNNMMDEAFKNISEQKGRYQEAKKMLDEFYNEP